MKEINRESRVNLKVRPAENKTEFYALCVKDGRKMNEVLNEWIEIALNKKSLDLK